MSGGDEEAVLETFDGYVDSVDGGEAFVTLESRDNGDVLHGVYPAEKLAALGVGEQSRFVCRVVARGEWTRVDIEPAPDIEITDEQVAAIRAKIDAAFQGGEGVNY